MDRFEALVAELDRRGWLGGAWRHQHDHNGSVGLAFGDPGMTEVVVSPTRDIPARTDTRRGVVYHAVAGEGYRIEFLSARGRQEARVATASAAVDLMDAWRAGLAEDHAAAFAAALSAAN